MGEDQEKTPKLPSKVIANITYCPLCQTTIVGETPKQHVERLHIAQARGAGMTDMTPFTPRMKTTIRVGSTEPSMPIHIASPMEARDIKEMPPECKECAFWVGCPYKYFSKGHCTRIS